MPDFCTRLGLKMGEAAFQAYAPDLPVRYAITRTMSRGDPYCEYILVALAHKVAQERGIISPTAAEPPSKK